MKTILLYDPAPHFSDDYLRELDSALKRSTNRHNAEEFKIVQLRSLDSVKKTTGKYIENIPTDDIVALIYQNDGKISALDDNILKTRRLANKSDDTLPAFEVGKMKRLGEGNVSFISESVNSEDMAAILLSALREHIQPRDKESNKTTGPSLP